MAQILLNDNTTGADISIDDSLLLKAYTSGGVTNVLYLKDEDGYRSTAKVSETLANVGGMSKLLIDTTDVDGNIVWLNKDRISSVYDISSLATVEFDAAGASLESFKSGETTVAITSAIIVKEGDSALDIGSFTNGPDTIILTAGMGDLTSSFTAGVVFTVFGEGGANDSIYSVVSSAWTTVTTITVTETPAVVEASNGGKVWLKA
jgi:hypothetical protein